MNWINNLLELNLEGRINKEQYTLKYDDLNTELLKVEEKIQGLLKDANRNESIKQRLNKFKSLFKDMEIVKNFDKDVFEYLIDKVIIGEQLEDGTKKPYTIRFICKNGTEINCKDNFTATSDKQRQNILQQEITNTIEPRGRDLQVTKKVRPCGLPVACEHRGSKIRRN